MTELEEQLEEIDSCIAGHIPQKLLKALRKAIEQRNAAYVCSWDKALSEMIIDDNKELLEILK